MSKLRVNSISTFTGDNISLTGSLLVTGNVRAEQFIATTVTSSIVYQSGSTQFGDTADDTHVFTGSLSVSNGITGSTDFDTLVNKPTLLSGSNQIASDISGSVTALSSSITTRISTNETDINALQNFSSSLDATFATDADLNLVSSSVDSLNAATGSYLTSLPAGLVSGSNQLAADISGSVTSLSSSLVTRIENQESFSSSLDATFATDADLNLVSSSVDSLNAATGSYLTSLPADLVSGSNQLAADISGSFTAVSASLAADIANITGSYAVSASVSTTYLSIADLKSLVASSATYNEFTASVAAL